jgi:hypothetical protein
MRLALITASLALIAAPAFAETRTYDFKSFTRLDIAAGYEVIFTQAPQRSVTIDSDDFSRIIAEQNGGTLRITRPKNTNLRGKVHDVVRISAPDLDEADLSAGVKFRTDGLDVDTLILDINAGVEAHFSRIKAQTITLDVNAGVEVDISGECGALTIEAEAGVDVDASGLRCRTADIDAGVGSSVRVYAIDSVKADASLGASISVAGNPKSIDKHASMGGSITIASR